MNNIVELKKITKQFADKIVLDGIDLDIKENSFTIIKGESGSGKTTILNLIGLLDLSFSGEYLFDSKKILGKDFFRIRNKYIGFIFQNYNLINGLSVIDNIKLPYLYYDGEIEDYDEYLSNLIKVLKIEDIIDKDVANLSGGEKQRVAICRALSLKPKLILADEPTGNLDLPNKKMVMEILRNINKDFGITIIIVSHDDIFDEVASNILYLRNGKVYEKNWFI